MPGSDPKSDLTFYLQLARDALLWKLDRLSEYDVRRPLTPTGTNLLGLVKHVATAEALYFGEIVGRPIADPLVCFDEAREPNVTMWARLDESRELIVTYYRRVWRHTDATIAALPLDSIVDVPWQPEALRTMTLHRLILHVLADIQRHAGQADILRESIDGAVGLRPGYDHLAPGDADWWATYRDHLEHLAREAGRARD